MLVEEIGKDLSSAASGGRARAGLRVWTNTLGLPTTARMGAALRSPIAGERIASAFPDHIRKLVVLHANGWYGMTRRVLGLVAAIHLLR